MMKMKKQELVAIIVYVFSIFVGILIYLTLASIWLCGPGCTISWINVGAPTLLWWLLYSFSTLLLNKINSVITLFVLCIVESFRNIALNRRYAILVETMTIYALSLDPLQALLYMVVSILALSLVSKIVKMLGLEMKIAVLEAKYCVQDKSAMVLSRELAKLVAYYTCMTFLTSLAWSEFLVLILNLPIFSPLLSSVLVTMIAIVMILVNLARGCVVKPVALLLAGLSPSGIIALL